MNNTWKHKRFTKVGILLTYCFSSLCQHFHKIFYRTQRRWRKITFHILLHDHSANWNAKWQIRFCTNWDKVNYVKIADIPNESDNKYPIYGITNTKIGPIIATCLLYLKILFEKNALTKCVYLVRILARTALNRPSRAPPKAITKNDTAPLPMSSA